MLSWEFPPSSTGGTAAHVDGLARAMRRAGHEVVLISQLVNGAPADTIQDGLRVLRVPIDMPWISEPSNAPPSVPRFQHTNRVSPVTQNEAAC